MSLRNRRKHVMNEPQWDDHHLPGRGQYIVKVLRSTGNNLHMVRTPSGEVHHVSMPLKFRRNIWVKRGNYVLVEPIEEGKQVKAEIVKILNKECIKFYKENKIWPEEFEDTKEIEQKDADDDFYENINRNNNILYNESSDEESETSEYCSGSEGGSDVEDENDDLKC